MKIVSIETDRACCEAGGIERDVDLYLLQNQPLAPGDFVLVHVGYAIQKIDRDEALQARALYDGVPLN